MRAIFKPCDPNCHSCRIIYYIKGVMRMDACALISAVTALSAVMARGRTTEEITMLSVIFTQLGDTLATIAAQQEICGSKTDGLEV